MPLPDDLSGEDEGRFLVSTSKYPFKGQPEGIPLSTINVYELLTTTKHVGTTDQLLPIFFKDTIQMFKMPSSS